VEAQQYQKVRGIFEAALDRPPEERTAFVEEACAEDVELRGEVQRLLIARSQESDFSISRQYRIIIRWTCSLAGSGAAVSSEHTGSRPKWAVEGWVWSMRPFAPMMHSANESR
jgi:hypothetical protein